MPPHLPPTPAPSGELNIKEHPIDAMSEQSFALPPAALSPVATDDGGSSLSRKGSVVFQTPISPTSPDGDHRRMSAVSSRAGSKRAAPAALDEFNLPPPPTRTRKIIQMKPKALTTTLNSSAAAQSSQRGTGKLSTSAKSAGTSAANTSSTAAAQQAQANSSSKKKQPSATSAAGRKIARKTAHSLIERRRRSKMNEEFATLKNMIPACRGQEMHKLAILQASIDYMNYLEECIAELKSTSSGKHTTSTPTMKAPPRLPSPNSPDLVIPEGGDEESTCASSAATSPALSPHSGPTQYKHQYQFNSLDVSSSSSSSYYPILPSPILGPVQSQNSNAWRTPSQPPSSATPSPAILPHQQQDGYRIPSGYTSSTASGTGALDKDSLIDHEASTALLMLNMDRRGAVEQSPQRSSLGAEERQRKAGMSVRDLLA